MRMRGRIFVIIKLILGITVKKKSTMTNRGIIHKSTVKTIEMMTEFRVFNSKFIHYQMFKSKTKVFVCIFHVRLISVTTAIHFELIIQDG